MIRTPSDREELYAWWRAALVAVEGFDTLRQAIAAGAEISFFEGEVHCGFFKTKMHAEGVFVPARIFMEQHIDRDGLLTQPEALCCEIIDEPWTPEEQWPYLAMRPITEDRYRYMMALGGWARENAPRSAEANPTRAVDWDKVEPPVFKKKRKA